MDNIKKRLLKYIDYKGISRREFCRVIGVSPTFLANDSEIGSNKLINIFSSYPDLSMSWLILEEGEMLNQKEIKQTDTEPNTEVFQLRAENGLLKEMLKEREGQISALNMEVGKLQERVSSFRLQDGESTGPIGLSGGGGGLPMPVDAPVISSVPEMPAQTGTVPTEKLTPRHGTQKPNP